MFLLTDGFDLISNITDLTRKWDFVNTSNLSYQATAGRYGGRALNWSSTFNPQPGLGHRLVTPTTKPRASMALLMPTVAVDDSSTARLIAFGVDTMSADGHMSSNAHVGIKMSSTNAGRIEAFRGTTSLGSTASQVIFANTWHRVELVVDMHDSTGVVEVWVDGILVLNLTGQDTILNTLANADTRWVGFGWHRNGIFTSQVVDDVAIWTGDAPDARDEIGDFIIETLRPMGDGDEVDATPSTGSAWSCVDEVGGPNSDTDYVQTTAVNDDTLFQMTNQSIGGNPLAVTVVNYVRGAAAGRRKIQHLVKTGGTEYASGTDQVVPSQNFYLRKDHVFGLNPATGVAWTTTEVNALQAGFRLTD